MVRAAADQGVARFMAMDPYYYLKSSYLVPTPSRIYGFVGLLRPMAACATRNRIHNNQMGGESGPRRDY